MDCYTVNIGKRRTAMKAFIGAKIYDTDSKSFIDRDIVTDGGIIKDILPHGAVRASGGFERSGCDAAVVLPGSCIADCTGKYIIPGLIDIHTHGAVGTEFDGKHGGDIGKPLGYYLSHGVTGIFPTTATEKIEDLYTFAGTLSKNRDSYSADVLGYHMEGPYLSKEKKGAHNEALLKNPDIGELHEMLRLLDGRAKFRVTLAPELPCAIEYIKEAAKCGASVTLGHTNSAAETIYKALDAGASSMTHLYNAMSPLGHREPGAVGAGLISDCFCELICDGFHVCPDVVKLTYSIKRDKLVLITDSLMCAGMKEDFTFMNAGETVYYHDGHALLANGTIAGSSLNLFDGVKNLSAFAGIPFAEALYCATASPAKAAGVYDKVGSLEVGKTADIVVLGEALDILSVYIKGEKRL